MTNKIEKIDKDIKKYRPNRNDFRMDILYDDICNKINELCDEINKLKEMQEKLNDNQNKQ